MSWAEMLWIAFLFFLLSIGHMMDVNRMQRKIDSLRERVKELEKEAQDESL